MIGGNNACPWRQSRKVTSSDGTSLWKSSVSASFYDVLQKNALRVRLSFVTYKRLFSTFHRLLVLLRARRKFRLFHGLAEKEILHTKVAVERQLYVVYKY